MSVEESPPGTKDPPDGTASPSIPPAGACATATGAMFSGGSRLDTVGIYEYTVVMDGEEGPCNLNQVESEEEEEEEEGAVFLDQRRIRRRRGREMST